MQTLEGYTLAAHIVWEFKVNICSKLRLCQITIKERVGVKTSFTLLSHPSVINT